MNDNFDNQDNLDIMDEVDINMNWRKHLDEMNTRLSSMWNYMIYNQFCDKEIIKLKNENTLLRRDTEDARSELFCIRLKHEKERKDKDDREDREDNKRKRKKYDVLCDEYRKVKRYKMSKKDEIQTNGLKLFSELNNINDIINLKNYPKKFDFVNNDKFKKLYNIIPALEELNKIIGMNNVKEKIFRSICYFLHDIKYSYNEMNHVMIMGPPGVGKTTIAKIIGNIYLRLGFLENDKFITASRSDLIAKYLGQTADKTQKVIDSALGGVLFIDEVYSLGSKEGRDSFAKECIDTINLNMSRTDCPWLLIVGGYKEEIEDHFLSVNKGLERRFTVKLEINGYDEKELFEILTSFIREEDWKMDDNAITISDIKEHKEKFKYFGGDMRKLFQLAKENYCVRSMKSSLTLDGLNKKLSRNDFQKSIEHFISNVKKEDNTSHLMMYI
jgi:energy-coupling factor transporter ATP-binding protein EcfA2